MFISIPSVARSDLRTQTATVGSSRRATRLEGDTKSGKAQRTSASLALGRSAIQPSHMAEAQSRNVSRVSRGVGP